MSETPAEANEADFVEQRLDLDDDDLADSSPSLAAPLEANEADVFEQHLSVPVQDDEYPA